MTREWSSLWALVSSAYPAGLGGWSLHPDTPDNWDGVTDVLGSLLVLLLGWAGWGRGVSLEKLGKDLDCICKGKG